MKGVGQVMRNFLEITCLESKRRYHSIRSTHMSSLQKLVEITLPLFHMESSQFLQIRIKSITQSIYTNQRVLQSYIFSRELKICSPFTSLMLSFPQNINKLFFLHQSFTLFFFFIDIWYQRYAYSSICDHPSLHFPGRPRFHQATSSISFLELRTFLEASFFGFFDKVRQVFYLFVFFAICVKNK